MPVPRPRLAMSLRTRLTAWYGALLALTLLAFSAFLYFTLQQSLSSSMDERLTLRADQLRREVGPSLGNLLQPEDVAPMVALLASKHGGWITGQVISISGGYSMV